MHPDKQTRTQTDIRTADEQTSDAQISSALDTFLNSHEDKYFNDSLRADRLVRQYGHNLRYCTERRSFYVWDGRRWIWDDFREIERLTEATMETAHLDAMRITDLRRREEFLLKISESKNRRQIQDVVHRAKSKVAAVSINDFDNDPWILNCNNGIVDLRTGDLCLHQRESMCSKMIPMNYDPSAECPVFLRFMESIMGGGEHATLERRQNAHQLVDCLQRIFGCCATGKFEKLLIVLAGRGGNNGKTTLLEIMRKALGDKQYAGEVLVDTLMQRTGGGRDNATQADIAQLKGCRMVTCSEPEEGQHLSISVIKYLVGGGQVKARRLREDPIVFQPTYKMLMDTNFPLAITNSNDVVWNRVKYIPFTVTFKHPSEGAPAWETIDYALVSKLEKELPGILAWIVRGAILYYEFGLEFPEAVTSVTEEYRIKSDHFPVFLHDCCTLGPNEWVPVTKLRQAYESWALSNSEDKMLSTAFNSRLEQIDCRSDRKRIDNADGKTQVRVWKGISLRPRRTAISIKPSDATSFQHK